MKKILLPLLSLAILASCSSDDNNDPIREPGAYEKGIFVTNEGPFNNGSGTITYISEDFSTVEQKVYKRVNGTDLGNIVQSMGFADNDAYIVVSNSQKIMIADRYTFKAKDSIVTGLVNPRYFAAASGKGYITDWGDPNISSDDYVAIVDLATNKITSKIPVSFGPEKMLAHDGKIYVAHQGAYRHNNVISVLSGSAVIKNILVGDAPESMVILGDDMYVLGSGKPDYTGDETPGSITRIDLTTNEAIQIFTFKTTDHPTALTANGTDLYFNLNGQIFKLDSKDIQLPGSPVIEGYFYTMASSKGKLYATDAADFASQGKLYVFDLSTNQQIKEIKTGIIPGGIYFNE